MEKLLQLLKLKKEKRDASIAKGKAAATLAEVRSAEDEIELIDAEIRSIETAIEEIKTAKTVTESRTGEENDDETNLETRSQQVPIGVTEILRSYGIGTAVNRDAEARKTELEKFEKRGADLKSKREVVFEINEMPELRAVTLASGTLVTETKYSKTINDTFNQVSSVIDLVTPIPLMGGEAYEQAFEVSTADADYSTEVANYSDADTVYDYVSIGKAKITAYTEISDEALKLNNVDYQARIRTGVVRSLRKKMSKQILIGATAANSINGIFNAPVNVIPTATDIIISEIDADTLDTIIFGYGGDEDVEGNGYLVLSKKDLSAFAAVRTAEGEKLYQIELNGNIGTISSDGSFKVPFIINSACPTLSAPTTADDTYCMAYGMMSAYEMPIFSPVTVEESRDFKFKTGQIAYRGSVWAGGNVAMYKGFVRVKKG